MHRKISGPFRIQSEDTGTEIHYALDPSSGGSRCKVVLYIVRVVSASSGAKVSISLAQGPDADSFGPRTTLLSATAVSTGDVLQKASGTPDTDADDVLNEWLRPYVGCSATSTEEWAVVEVWETRKAF